MDLGKRIRDARLAAGLSQKALCGDTITRNMLSLIESGRAKPSMETLRFLAEGLKKPISYFLEEDGVLSPNQGIMKEAKTAFSAGQYKVCLTVLEDYTPDGIFDDEKALLQDLALLLLAEAALNDNRNIYAKELLRRMTFQGLYQVAERKARQQLLLAKAGETVALPADDEALGLRAELALRQGDCEKAEALLKAMERRDGQWQLLRGQVAVALEDFRGAVSCLTAAEAEFPKQAVPLLERCYRELEDYKMAYAYALKLRGE